MRGSVAAFLAEPHVATLTTLRPDGSPHVAPVRFTYDPAERIARMLTYETCWCATDPGSRCARACSAG
ncbi:pyridoxamine 5'-phosphate oxidase family protein [Actinocatenispora rupis]|uniref:pyridoxamine 5'-phosphate oxidase family protein n=1 Tax=Actinocatenispora rupis TaxID=519421 RepID=UPI001EF1EF96